MVVERNRLTRAEKAIRQAEVIKLARQGVTTANIVKAVRGVTATQVRRWRKEAGIASVEARPPLTAEQIERARQLMSDGASRAEAARSVGGTPDQLRHALPDLGGWTREQQTEFEHGSGLRPRITPKLGPPEPRVDDRVPSESEVVWG